MNNKGQVLVLFVILIPVLIIVSALIVDTGLILKEKSKLVGTTKVIMAEMIDEGKTIAQAKDLYIENDIPVANLEITQEGTTIKINNSYQIKSAFGDIIGISSYKINIIIEAYKKENKIIFNKE